MYLIKGDKVAVLDEKTDDTGQKWYYINYKGKKDLYMWIKEEAIDIESSVETNESSIDHVVTAILTQRVSVISTPKYHTFTPSCIPLIDTPSDNKG